MNIIKQSKAYYPGGYDLVTELDFEGLTVIHMAVTDALIVSNRKGTVKTYKEVRDYRLAEPLVEHFRSVYCEQ